MADLQIKSELALTAPERTLLQQLIMADRDMLDNIRADELRIKAFLNDKKRQEELGIGPYSSIDAWIRDEHQVHTTLAAMENQKNATLAPLRALYLDNQNNKKAADYDQKKSELKAIMDPIILEANATREKFLETAPPSISSLYPIIEIDGRVLHIKYHLISAYELKKNFDAEDTFSSLISLYTKLGLMLHSPEPLSDLLPKIVIEPTDKSQIKEPYDYREPLEFLKKFFLHKQACDEIHSAGYLLKDPKELRNHLKKDLYKKALPLENPLAKHPDHKKRLADEITDFTVAHKKDIQTGLRICSSKRLTTYKVIAALGVATLSYPLLLGLGTLSGMALLSSKLLWAITAALLGAVGWKLVDRFIVQDPLENALIKKPVDTKNEKGVISDKDTKFVSSTPNNSPLSEPVAKKGKVAPSPQTPKNVHTVDPQLPPKAPVKKQNPPNILHAKNTKSNINKKLFADTEANPIIGVSSFSPGI